MKHRLSAMVIAALGLYGQQAFGASDLYRIAWTSDPASSATIAWRQLSGDDAHIMMGTSSDGTAWTREDIDQSTSLQHPSDAVGDTLDSQIAYIDNLLPNTAYYFQVCDSEGCGEISWFQTAPNNEAEFTFIAGGDSRTNQEPRQIGMALIAKIRPLFVLFNGDFTDVGSREQWVSWLDDWQASRSADGRMYPIVATHGNHENDVLDMLHYVFGVPQKAFYGLNVGGDMMRIYTLNSEAEPSVGYGAYALQTDAVWNEQASWLSADSAVSSATWKLGNYHRPMRPHTSGKAEGDGRIAAWAQTFTDNGFDVLVESDTHMAKYTFPVVLASGEGSYQDFKRDDLNGSLLIGEGSWGAPTRPTDDDKPWTMDSASFWQFKLIHASPAKLDIRTVRFGSETEMNAGTLPDPDSVTALSQAEQNANAFAIPSGLPLWKPLSGEVISLPATGFNGVEIENVQLVGTGALWRFLDDGSSPSNWQNADYDDNSWSTGNAALGYGDGDESTEISFGSDPNNKYTSAYFRRHFTVDYSPEEVIKLTLRLQRDDGAVVYINGQEALRNNMPDGDISASTFAVNAIGGAAESIYYEFALQPGLLQAGDNVIAVEVHQADASSSDVSFDMDLTAVVSNVVGSVPVVATTLTATAVSVSDIELSWDDVAEFDEIGYQLERKNKHGYWDILTWRIDANTTYYMDSQLEEGVSYEYRIRPYNAVGLAAASDSVLVATQSDAIPRIYEEDFEDGTVGDMTTFSRSSDKDWAVASFGGLSYASANGYQGDSGSDDWLITPSFALDYYRDASFGFDVAYNFGGPLIKLMYSTDYRPEVSADPSAATWLEIPECAATADALCWNEPSTGSYTFESSLIDLAGISGESVHFAFQYLSDSGTSGDGRVWQIDNIVLRGIYQNAVISGSDFAGGIPSEWTNFNSGSAKNWEAGSAAGIDGAFINGFGDSEPSNDWLVFPEATLVAGSDNALEFDFYKKYDGPELKIMVSIDYVDGADPASATWTDLNIELPDLYDAWATIGPISLAAYEGKVHIAFVYTSTGGGSGDAAAIGIGNARIVKALAGVKQQRELLSEGFDAIGALGSFSAYSRSSNADWIVETRKEQQGAVANGFGADEISDDWLISPALTILNWQNALAEFEIYTNYGGPALEILISNNYSGGGDPLAEGVTWEPLAVDQSGEESDAWNSYSVSIAQYTGTAYIAFRYTTTGTGSGEGRRLGVDNFKVLSNYGEETLRSSFSLAKTEYTTIEPISFLASVSGGKAPFTYAWDFGDGNGSGLADPQHIYASAGVYSVSLSVTDADGKESTIDRSDFITVIASTNEGVVSKQGDIRIATFNAYLNRNSEGQILEDALSGDDAQIANVAEIIQRVRPEVLLLNEFDYIAGGSAVQALLDNYLNLSQNGAEAIDYPYVYLAESNTGIMTPYDFNNDGEAGSGGDDAYGFGVFPGQYGMVVLSQYPIATEQVRTFQKFLWKDMPDALLPIDPETGESWFTDEELAVFRLSSKSHWDVPVQVGDQLIHILASHPTPPVFDGEEDRNGKRNHDETRFWADYVDPVKSFYIYDDSGVTGGLAADTRFVILGDLNASSAEGDATGDPIALLTTSSFIDGSPEPSSVGGVENDPDNTNSVTHTADWMMRADYVLPSVYGLAVDQTAVFWPGRADVLYRLVGPSVKSSDHRLVFADISITDVSTDPGTDPDTDTDTSGSSKPKDKDKWYGSSGYEFLIFAFALLGVGRLRKKK